MLEKACLAVESAGKRGDVYPDVLFNVARQWDWLHENLFGRRSSQHSHSGDSNGEASPNSPTTEGNQVVPYSCSMNAVSVANSIAGHPVMMPYGAPPRIPHAIPLPIYHHTGYQDYIPVDPYMANSAAQPGFHGYIAAGHIPSNALPGPGRRGGPIVHRQNMPPNSHGMHWNLQHQCPPYHAACHYSPGNNPSPGVPLPIRPLPAQGVPPQQQHGMGGGQYPCVLPPNARGMPPPPVVTQAQTPPLQHMAQSIQQQQHPGLFYLDAAYRVGMLAVDTLARRVHDERTQSRFSPNPPYGEDIKWLLEISKRLGKAYL